MRSRRPKVLHAIGGRSLVEHAVSAARGTRPDHLVVVVRHHRDLVAEHVTSLDPDVLVADQDEVPGTGRAVECALDRLPDDLDGTVLVTYGDVPLLTSETLLALLESHTSGGGRGHPRHGQPGRPHRLRTGPAGTGRRRHRHRRAEGRHPGAALDRRGELRPVRVRPACPSRGARRGRHATTPRESGTSPTSSGSPTPEGSPCRPIRWTTSGRPRA